jgi:hypothetical protein
MSYRRLILLGLLLLAVRLGHACEAFRPTGPALAQTKATTPWNAVPSLISEEAFTRIAHQVGELYAAEALAEKATIAWDLRWSSANLQAGAWVSRPARDRSRSWNFILHGGLARHPAMTEDAWVMVICHELGHAIGGAPLSRAFAPPGRETLLTNEGQADYFAALKCARRFHRAYPAAVAGDAPDEAIRTACAAAHADVEDARICERTSVAGVALGKVLRDLFNPGGVAPTIATPDRSIARRTNPLYPSPQCRLDTYFQGSLCEVPAELALHARRADIGTCHPRNGHTTGSRPLCWYRP